MISKQIPVDVISANSSYIDVKLPFLDIPVKMNHELFKKRLSDGYFKVRKRSKKKLVNQAFIN